MCYYIETRPSLGGKMRFKTTLATLAAPGTEGFIRAARNSWMNFGCSKRAERYCFIATDRSGAIVYDCRRWPQGN